MRQPRGLLLWLVPTEKPVRFAQPFTFAQVAPFFIAGTLKIIYDLLFYKSFIATQPPEETR